MIFRDKYIEDEIERRVIAKLKDTYLATGINSATIMQARSQVEYEMFGLQNEPIFINRKRVK